MQGIKVKIMVDDNFVKWGEFKPYNQVKYGNRIALITGEKQDEQYPISIINEEGHVECSYAKESKLRPIKLDEDGDIIKRCKPCEITPYNCTFCSSDCENKVTFTFVNNYCKIIKDGNEIFEGAVSELHVLQNMLREILGWELCVSSK